jgi:FkbM family methyltransferase
MASMATPFVSYAQNFEDVVLWRALRDVEQGFYIDVGAHSPLDDSVTRAFYERGWRGINIEPNPRLFPRFAELRAEDINLDVAVADHSGEETMTLAGDSGLSTLDDDQAVRLAAQGVALTQRPVRVLTLAEIWDAHVPAGRDVQFLKVDVEGLEGPVLAGGDWQRHRPWVVVVEATRPGTTEPSHESWEPMLLEAAYEPVYADGLNRFYVAAEHPELRPAFRYPPNVFDGFIRASEARARTRAAHAEAEFRAIRGSRSWWVTAPIRRATSWARRISGSTRAR